MLVEKGISPKEMILVTFTAKAAKEMNGGGRGIRTPAGR